MLAFAGLRGQESEDRTEQELHYLTSHMLPRSIDDRSLFICLTLMCLQQVDLISHGFFSIVTMDEDQTFLSW